MSEVDEILNNLPRDEQSRRRVREWIQSQIDDGSEQESESQAGRNRKDPSKREKRRASHRALNGQDSGSNGGNIPTRVESPMPANPGDSPLSPGSTAALGKHPRREHSVSDGLSATLGGSKHKGKENSDTVKVCSAL